MVRTRRGCADIGAHARAHQLRACPAGSPSALPRGALLGPHGLPATLVPAAHPRPPDGRRRPFHAPRAAPASLLAADDRAHCRLDRVGDPAHVVMMPRAAPKPDRCRALELLASCNGATEAIMLAHGFTVP